MLQRPSSCNGCSLNIPSSLGFMREEGFPSLGVTLMGDQLGDADTKHGVPFKGSDGVRLEKMIESAGYSREDFAITNAVWCQPEKNREAPQAAIEHCKRHWEPKLGPRTKVIVPLGDVALFATTGHEGILSRRGYVEWSEKYQAFILPTVHPKFIRAGNSNWEAAFLYDLRHAVEVAKDGWTPVERDYTLDAGVRASRGWVDAFLGELRRNPLLWLAADLETPDKSAAEDETNINLGFLPGPIYRISFAYVDSKGRTKCISMPWDVNHLSLIKEVLGSGVTVCLCYRHFDAPRIKAHGVVIRGAVLDEQEMWHVLHSDLPKSLEHITPYLVPNQPAWKHLNVWGSQALYNAIDSGVTVEGALRLRVLLKEAKMWDLYWRDVHQLNEILIYMSDQGMPINPQKRAEASIKLSELKEANRGKLNDAASEARPNKIYKKFREGLEEIELNDTENYCTECDKRVPGDGKKHPHFKRGVAAGEVSLGRLAARGIKVTGYIQPLDFKPSNTGLIRYAKFRGYKLNTKWDRDSGTRKIVMDENSVRRYALDHPTDKLWPLALEERELGKLLSTYVGKLTDEPEKPRIEQDEWWAAFKAAQYVKPPEGSVRDRSPQLVTHVPYVKGEEDDDIPF